MDLNVKFDHSFRSITELHRQGIRSTAWLEEAIEDSQAKVFEITQPQDLLPVFFKVGFCQASIPILYIFEFENRIVSRQTRKASPVEIRKFWCR